MGCVRPVGRLVAAVGTQCSKDGGGRCFGIPGGLPLMGPVTVMVCLQFSCCVSPGMSIGGDQMVVTGGSFPGGLDVAT
jgi:hypothetical protein